VSGLIWLQITLLVLALRVALSVAAMVAKTKLVEQLTLVTLQTAHHGSTSPRIASTQRNHASRFVSTDFCNKIGT
jgi:hypothetical protein